MIQELETLAELRGSLMHLALTLNAIKPRIEKMEHGLDQMAVEYGRMVERFANPPAPMPRQEQHVRYYRASRAATMKAWSAMVATGADLAGLMETLDSTIDRLNTAAYVVAADSTTDDEGTDDAAV